MKYLIFYNGNNVVLGIHNAPMLESFWHWKYFYRRYKIFYFESIMYMHKHKGSSPLITNLILFWRETVSTPS